MSEINPEFLLGVMPPAEAKLYRVLIGMIPAPGAEAPNLARRQIEMAELAKLTGFTKRWVIELMQRLEKKDFIRTDGGSGAVKWIWLLPLGVPRLGRPFPPELTKKAAPRPGKAKTPRVAASIPKHRRQEMAQSSKPDADIHVASPVEQPAEIPVRRRKGSPPSIPPANPAVDNPVVSATRVIPPPPPAPADPALPAGMMPPAPPTKALGGPAARNPVVRRAAKIGPPPSVAPGDLAAGNVVVPAAMMPPAPSAAPGGTGPGNPVVMATRVPPSAASSAGKAMRTAKVDLPPSTASGAPAAGIPVVPAAMVTPEPAVPALPAKRVSPRRSTKKLPAGRSHWESAPIEELVAYACSLPVTPELIYSLKTPGMTGGLLVLALERLCQRIERYGLKPYPDRSSLVTALRTILIDL